MALTVTSNLTEITTADSITGWTAVQVNSGWGVDGDQNLQGSGCIAATVKAAATRAYLYYTYGSDIDLDDKLLRVWARFKELSKFRTMAQGGITLYIEDSSGNWLHWEVGGSDVTGSAWNNFVVQTSTGPWDSSTSYPAMDQIRVFGISVIMDTKPARSDNMFIDAIRVGEGYTITGTNTVEGDGWSEIAAIDEHVDNKYGVLTKSKGGIYILTGKIVFGDSGGTGSVDFSDNTNATILTPSYIYGSCLEIENSDIGIEVVGNGTGTTDFELGTLLGTGDDRQGILGGTMGAVWDRFKFDSATDSSDIDSCNLYGVTFENCKNVQLSGSTTQEAIGCLGL